MIWLKIVLLNIHLLQIIIYYLNNIMLLMHIFGISLTWYSFVKKSISNRCRSDCSAPVLLGINKSASFLRRYLRAAGKARKSRWWRLVYCSHRSSYQYKYASTQNSNLVQYFMHIYRHICQDGYRLLLAESNSL